MGRSTCNCFIGLKTDLLSISNTNSKADSINGAVLSKSLTYILYISTSYTLTPKIWIAVTFIIFNNYCNNISLWKGNQTVSGLSCYKCTLSKTIKYHVIRK